VLCVALMNLSISQYHLCQSSLFIIMPIPNILTNIIYLIYILRYKIRLSIQLSTYHYTRLILRSCTTDGHTCVLLVYRSVSNITPHHPFNFRGHLVVAPMPLRNPYPSTHFISGSNTLL